MSMDPLIDAFPNYSPYHFTGNTPIQAKDYEDLEVVFAQVDVRVLALVYGPISVTSSNQVGFMFDGDKLTLYDAPALDIGGGAGEPPEKHQLITQTLVNNYQNYKSANQEKNQNNGSNRNDSSGGKWF